jgi:hypothetical protein
VIVWWRGIFVVVAFETLDPLALDLVGHRLANHGGNVVPAIRRARGAASIGFPDQAHGILLCRPSRGYGAPPTPAAAR